MAKQTNKEKSINMSKFGKQMQNILLYTNLCICFVWPVGWFDTYSPLSFLIQVDLVTWTLCGPPFGWPALSHWTLLGSLGTAKVLWVGFSQTQLFNHKPHPIFQLWLHGRVWGRGLSWSKRIVLQRAETTVAERPERSTWRHNGTLSA